MRFEYLAFPILAAVFFCGCDVPVEQFPPNDVYALVVSTSRQTPTDLAAQDTAAVVEAWFGTPKDPRWPVEQFSDDAAKTLVNPQNLTRAAGPVFSDRENRHFGLFTEHCVTCHGVSGGGDGPASLLQNPYPRDFRAGIFKWKSTSGSAKPIRADLMATLVRGGPGSGMPAFEGLAAEDLEALVDYVIFLSVRGEFERRLVSGAIDELGYESTRPEQDASLLSLLDATDETDALWFAQETLDPIAKKWVDAGEKVIVVPDETPFDADSIRRGDEIFHGKIANCSGCHGDEGNSDLVPERYEYDDWTKEFTSRLSITPTDRDAVRPFRKAGALRPRQIYPRKLSLGVYRGGGDPQTLYRRLISGIPGTPMPGVIISDQPSQTGLTSDQLWDLVHYVRSLGGEKP